MRDRFRRFREWFERGWGRMAGPQNQRNLLGEIGDGLAWVVTSPFRLVRATFRFVRLAGQNPREAAQRVGRRALQLAYAARAACGVGGDGIIGVFVWLWVLWGAAILKTALAGGALAFIGTGFFWFVVAFGFGWATAHFIQAWRGFNREYDRVQRIDRAEAEAPMTPTGQPNPERNIPLQGAPQQASNSAPSRQVRSVPPPVVGPTENIDGSLRRGFAKLEID